MEPFILNYNKKLAWFYVSQADPVQKEVDNQGRVFCFIRRKFKIPWVASNPDATSWRKRYIDVHIQMTFWDALKEKLVVGKSLPSRN